MHTLTLISAAGLRRPVFPSPESFCETARARHGASERQLRAADRTWCGPDAMSRASATALGLDPLVEPALAEIDYGCWQEKSLDELAILRPSDLRSWVENPYAAPHGGEAIADLIGRVGNWLLEIRGLSGRSLAVAPASAVKAAIVTVLDAPPLAFSRMDIKAFSVSRLVSDGRRWSLRSFNEPLPEVAIVQLPAVAGLSRASSETPR